MLWHDGLEGRVLGKRTRDRRRAQLTDDLLEKKNYTDLKKAAEDRSVWRTVRRDCHLLQYAALIVNVSICLACFYSSRATFLTQRRGVYENSVRRSIY